MLSKVFQQEVLFELLESFCEDGCFVCIKNCYQSYFCIFLFGFQMFEYLLCDLGFSWKEDLVGGVGLYLGIWCYDLRGGIGGGVGLVGVLVKFLIQSVVYRCLEEVLREWERGFSKDRREWGRRGFGGGYSVF